MGAYIHTDTGRVLFVASGVERPDPIGAASTDCDPFQNFKFVKDELISIQGRWCPRREIGDNRDMWLDVAFWNTDSITASFSYIPDLSSNNKIYTSLNENFSVTVLHHDEQRQSISAKFSGVLMHTESPLLETIRIESGRLDATYSLTP